MASMEGTPEEKNPSLPSIVVSTPPVVEMPSEKVQELFASAPPEKQQELVEIMLRQSILAKSHRGPLPPPDDLERYCKLIPNGGDRIMVRHEKQSDHRMKIEESTITSQNFQSGIGQWMGFALGLFGLGVSGFCIYTGHDAAGGTTLIGLVSVFVAGKTEIIKSLLEKRPQLSGSENSEVNSVEADRQLGIRKRETLSPAEEAKLNIA